MSHRLTLSAAIMALTLTTVATEATAQQSVADFYKGKNFRVIVGSSEASGVDILARVASRHLPKYMEGKPTIIVQNKRSSMLRRMLTMASAERLGCGGGRGGNWGGKLGGGVLILGQLNHAPCKKKENGTRTLLARV